MRKMSQIATTIEQSKRLLEAGLDPGSADMWWTIIQPLKQDGWKLVPDGQPYSMLSLYKGEHIALASFEDIPAWSLSRLWDAFGLDILGGWFSVGSSTSEDVIDDLVRMIEERHANH